jgi:hypothetical protein
VGRKTVVVYTDDYTGQEIPEADAQEHTLRLGDDEWKIVLTGDSYKALVAALEPFTASAEYKNRAPVQKAPQANSATPSVPSGHVTVLEPIPSNKVLRTWWRSLKTADLRQYGLNAPTSDRGKIPDAVWNAYAAAHPEAPVPAIPVVLVGAPAQ